LRYGIACVLFFLKITFEAEFSVAPLSAECDRTTNRVIGGVEMGDLRVPWRQTERVGLAIGLQLIA
jgi:hypothetical protein